MLVQVNRATADMKNTNVRLKQTLFQVSSTKGLKFLECQVSVLTSSTPYPDKIQSELLHRCYSSVHYSGDCCVSIQVSSMFYCHIAVFFIPIVHKLLQHCLKIFLCHFQCLALMQQKDWFCGLLDQMLFLQDTYFLSM